MTKSRPCQRTSSMAEPESNAVTSVVLPANDASICLANNFISLIIFYLIESAVLSKIGKDRYAKTLPIVIPGQAMTIPAASPLEITVGRLDRRDDLKVFRPQ